MATSTFLANASSVEREREAEREREREKKEEKKKREGRLREKEERGGKKIERKKTKMRKQEKKTSTTSNSFPETFKSKSEAASAILTCRESCQPTSCAHSHCTSSRPATTPLPLGAGAWRWCRYCWVKVKLYERKLRSAFEKGLG